MYRLGCFDLTRVERYNSQSLTKVFSNNEKAECLFEGKLCRKAEMRVVGSGWHNSGDCGFRWIQ